MLERFRGKDCQNAATASTASHACEPTVFTDEGIKQWVEEQEHYAKRMSDDDPRHSGAVLVLACAADILMRLTRASAELQQRVEKRRQEILGELRLEWHERKPTTEPPLAVLNANAQRQAYCETRADVMALVQRIIALRKGVAQPNEKGRIHYRPVKRVR